MAAHRKCVPKKVGCLNEGRTSSKQKEKRAKAIRELRRDYNQDLLLKAAGMARSTFYYYQKTRQDKRTNLKTQILQIYHHHQGRYGYRRIMLAVRKQGIIVNHKTVLRIMRELGIKSLVKVKKYKSYKGELGKIAPNLLQRNFYAAKPNQKWVTDVTEFSVGGEKLYLSPIMDLYNGEIISYTLDRHSRGNQTVEMLKNALTKLPKKTKLIIHSDQGWQYQMKAWQRLFKGNKIRQSMSRKGNCLDNAAMEGFFSILKSELFYLKKYDSIITLEKDIREYIEYYNNDRIKLKLNGLSPIQYRTQAA
ncbi:IS3 family transposase [Chitinophaga sp. OAE865]|uniref:IS3 family transposase n=1 Tax=Chitinophaga sp. OAE865 TaxID=2817898 RepID=UPI001AE52FEF